MTPTELQTLVTKAVADAVGRHQKKTDATIAELRQKLAAIQSNDAAADVTRKQAASVETVDVIKRAATSHADVRTIVHSAAPAMSSRERELLASTLLKSQYRTHSDRIEMTFAPGRPARRAIS